MSGDVTFQALDRLSWLPDRDASQNSVVIAGQKYYDVFFTGGVISNVTLENVIVSPALRTTAATTVNATADDAIIILTSTSDISFSLPSSPGLNQTLSIKKYSTGSNIVTISGNGKQIDGASSYPMGGDYPWLRLQYNESFWSILG